MRNWLFVATVGSLLSCRPQIPPQPPPPPEECMAGVPWCRDVGQTCSSPASPCKHNPTADPNHCELAPACPAPPPPGPVGCVPATIPSYAPPMDDEVNWKLLPGSTPQQAGAVIGALQRSQAACPSAWDGSCLSAGPPGIDLGYARVAGELHRAGIPAGQLVDASGKRADAIFVGIGGTALWEEWKLFEYARGCLTGNPYKNTFEYMGQGGPNPGPPPPIPTPPPPPQPPGELSPIPPKVGNWGGPKAHNRWNDSTPKFYEREAPRWDGSTSRAYCSTAIPGFEDLWCPCRPEGDPLRLLCEQIGVSGRPGGAPLWRSDGAVLMKDDNVFQARCSECTWLEVCAADGTACSRCPVSAATGLCQ